jgi:hypothetical protein
MALAKTILPAVATLIATSIHPAFAGTTTPANIDNPVANSLGSISRDFLLPVVERGIGIATIGGLGFMAFRPDKQEMIKHMAGIGLAGSLGVSSLWFLDHFVFNAQAASATGFSL